MATMPRSLDSTRLPPRCLGAFGPPGGPTLVVVAGMHGNEPAGVVAFRRVAAQLGGPGDARLRGRLAGLRGNCRALSEGVRYLDRDLNRMWGQPPALAHGSAFRAASASGRREAAETAERRELLAALDQAMTAARGQVAVLDLHTTSSDSAPFAVVCDRPAARDLAAVLPLPHVLGLEEAIPGTLTAYLARNGVAAVGIEGGRHEAPEAVDRLASALRLALVATGCDDEDLMGGLDEARTTLVTASAGVPGELELTHRHPVAPGDGFAMRGGFASFDAVAAGTPLADDRSGPVLAPADGLLLMPLYQGLGDDGFFIVRPRRPLP